MVMTLQIVVEDWKHTSSEVAQNVFEKIASASMKYDPSSCVLSQRPDSKEEKKPLSCVKVAAVVTNSCSPIWRVIFVPTAGRGEVPPSSDAASALEMASSEVSSSIVSGQGVAALKLSASCASADISDDPPEFDCSQEEWRDSLVW